MPISLSRCTHDPELLPSSVDAVENPETVRAMGLGCRPEREMLDRSDSVRTMMPAPDDPAVAGMAAAQVVGHGGRWPQGRTILPRKSV